MPPRRLAKEVKRIQYLRCPNLQTLSIKKCPNVTDDSMSRIAYRCPTLSELDVSYNYKISHHSLVVIGTNCPNLKILKRNMPVAGSPQWRLDGSRIDLGSDIRAIARYMPNLERLELQNLGIRTNKVLDPIREGCSNLQYLDIAGKTLRVVVFGNSTSKLKKLKTFIGPRLVVRTPCFRRRITPQPRTSC